MSFLKTPIYTTQKKENKLENTRTVLSQIYKTMFLKTRLQHNARDRACKI